MSLRMRDRLANPSSYYEGVASFIRKTYELLQDRAHSDLITWSDCGNFLIIKDVQAFSQKILPTYFKHSNMNSFVRQLNMYNFHKKRTMTTDHVYYHDLFKRGNGELLKHIKRKNSEMSPNMGSMFELSNNYGLTTDEINHENSLLRRLNQKAFAQISCLETKVKSLLQENELLYRKINEKEKNELLIESAFSKCFAEGKPERSEFYLKEMKESNTENENNELTHQKSLNTEKSDSESHEISYNSNPSLDSLSNIDSYIGPDSLENIENKPLTNSSTKNSLTYLSYSDLSQLPNEDEMQPIHKKKILDIRHPVDNQGSIEIKAKRISYQTTTPEEDQLASNFMEFDFSGFLELQEERF